MVLRGRLSFIWIIGLQSILWTSRALACPAACNCHDATVRCLLKRLRHIPSNIPSATTILDLRFNDLTSLREGSFPDLPSLRVLLLNKNKISVIEPGAFNNFGGLKTLYIYKNQLTSIKSGAFKGLKNLEQLHLQSNLIRSVDADVFKDMPKIKRIELQSNRLTSVPDGIFQHVPQLRRLRLDGNPLRCDCGLLGLAQFLNKSRDVIGNHTVLCQKPQHMKGRDVSQMNLEEFSCNRPQILLAPSDVVMHGDHHTARFDCTAEGLPKPEIVWLHNGEKLQSNRGKELLPNGTLILRNVRGKDMGMYQCLAINALGATRAKRAYLTQPEERQPHTAVARRERQQQESPRFSSRPRDTEIVIGDSLHLSCRASGNPRPTVTWALNERLLQHSSNVAISLWGDLRIQRVDRHHDGIYRCHARNVLGHISSAARVHVSYPPEFTIRPSDVSVTEGSPIKLHCDALGYPEPLFHWSKENTILRSTRERNFENSSRVMAIYPLLRQDAGEYHCHATNPFGSVEAKALVQIRSSAPPSIITAPSGVSVNKGETAIFDCRARGTPVPDIHWLFNGSPIPTVRGHYEISRQGTLYIHNVGLQDVGHYTCQAVNDVGAQSADTTLKVQVTDAQNPVDDALIRSSVAEATQNVDRAINATQRNLYTGRAKTASELLAIFRFPGPQARALSRVREIYEETLNIIHQHIQRGLKFNLTDFSYQSLLSDSHRRLISELSGCHIHTENEPCTDICFHSRYRTYDGTCNNYQHPMWGASLTPFRRLLPPIYENGFNTPVGATRGKLYHGYPKPNARLVSTTVMRRDHGTVPQDEKFTAMLMQWGQFVDHDIDFGVAAPSTAVFQSGRDCSQSCDEPNRPPCFNILIPEGDRRRGNLRCMEFERTGAICGSGETSVLMNRVMHREQVNVITSFLDASNVYGSNERDCLELRDLFADHGLLKFDIVSHTQKPYLPFNRNTPVDCQRNSSVPHTVRCFLAGDYRANEQLGLLAMHTIWHREHNRIAGQVLEINPHWDGERIYQETRKIIGAMVQHITFQHWLPKVLGPEGMKRIGHYDGYKPDVQPSIANVFATAAYRFGHTLINPILYRYNASFQEVAEGHLPLHKAFFAPERLLNEGGTDPLLRGLFASKVKMHTANSMLNDELTERLFSAAHEVDLDLAALNVQRGRDHALPGYTDWRRYCNLTVPQSWNELRSDIANIDLLQRLQQVYGHPGNMDVWIGGLSERHVPGAKIGPLFMCIIADQFKRIRDGDRFWYENPGVFDAVKLAEIKKATLAKVLCNDGDSIDRVPLDVFVHQPPSSFQTCSKIPDLNLHLWQECCNDCSQYFRYQTENADESDVSPIIGQASRRKRSIRSKHMYKLSGATESGHVKSGVVNHDVENHEDRIKFLEEAIMSLQGIVEDLSKVTGSKDAQSCRDDSGKLRYGDESWSPDRCSTCQCKDGQIWCSTVPCT